jgi:hypothetical protein
VVKHLIINHFFQIQQDRELVGAISLCRQSFQGFFKDRKQVFDIVPIHERLHKYLPGSNNEHGYHIVKIANKVLSNEEDFSGQDEFAENESSQEGDEGLVDWSGEEVPESLVKANQNLKIGPEKVEKRSGGSNQPIIIETGIFMDCEGYDLFKRHSMNFKDLELLDFILQFVNGIQGIYNYPSLGRKVTFSIMHIEIQKKCKIDCKGADLL